MKYYHPQFRHHKKLNIESRKMRRFVKTARLKASFTIEAAIIVSLIIFTIVAGFNIGFDLFNQSKTIIEIHEEIKELNPVKIVRRNH